MPFLTSLLRDSLLSEADPIQAGLQVDFEEREADPSKYTIGQNIHPASEMEDEAGGDDGMMAPYDGTQMAGGVPPMGGAAGPPTDEEMQQIQPGMPAPQGAPGQPPMQEGFMKDQLDLFLDQLLDEDIEEITEAPFDWTQ